MAPSPRGVLDGARATFRTAVFLLKVFPMLPSRPVNWITRGFVVEPFTYPSTHGPMTGDLYRPQSAGPHPGIIVCLGVVPFGVEHPQVPRLGEALARSGFAALLYWSPAMRDFRLDQNDIEDIASAYEAFLAHPAVDDQRSGILGTCVGGAFALMAAAEARIRERVAFVLAYAPYASMRTLARDIASASKPGHNGREPWDVDPLTRTVFVHCVTASLEPAEAAELREKYAERREHLIPDDGLNELSASGRLVAPLLGALNPQDAEAALAALPPPLREHLDRLSPKSYLENIRAPLVVLLHDHDDPVSPVAESRALRDALGALRPVQYTEFTVFTHLDPTRSNPSRRELARELLRFSRAIHPLFRSTR